MVNPDDEKLIGDLIAAFDDLQVLARYGEDAVWRPVSRARAAIHQAADRLQALSAPTPRGGGSSVAESGGTAREPKSDKGAGH